MYAVQFQPVGLSNATIKSVLSCSIQASSAEAVIMLSPPSSLHLPPSTHHCCCLSPARLEAYAKRGAEPPGEVQVYTWPDATLRELAELVKEVRPDARRG
jgi:hypothetical protein